MLVAALTAAIVFLVGKPLLPRRVPPAPPAPARQEPVAPVSPPAVDARAATPDAAVASDGAAAESDAKAATPGDAAAEAEPEKPAEAPSAEAKPSEEEAGKPGDASQADKDVARAAWRRNKPDISTTGTRATLIIPLKGRSAGGSYKYFKKTHAIVVTLPRAASMITMKFYKLHRDGFSALWIDQEEVNAKASDGTKLRIVLTAHSPPIVEITDDYVKVTIAKPTAARTPAAGELMEPK